MRFKANADLQLEKIKDATSRRRREIARRAARPLVTFISVSAAQLQARLAEDVAG